MSTIRLILFDVDGTLVLGTRRLRGWFEEALIEVYGQAGDIDGHSFSGKIDPQIVDELLSAAGLSPSEIEAGLPATKAESCSRRATPPAPHRLSTARSYSEQVTGSCEWWSIGMERSVSGTRTRAISSTSAVAPTATGRAGSTTRERARRRSR